MQNKKKALQFFGILADETRLEIVLSIAKGSKTVSKIHKKVSNVSLSAISHQLKLLYNVGIVEFEKVGRERKYLLSDKFCWCILKSALNHGSHCPACSKVMKEGLK